MKMNEIEEKVLRYKEFNIKKVEPVITVDNTPVVISHKILETDGSWRKFDKDGNRVFDDEGRRGFTNSFKVLSLGGSWQYFDYNNNEITKEEYKRRSKKTC